MISHFACFAPIVRNRRVERTPSVFALLLIWSALRTCGAFGGIPSCSRGRELDYLGKREVGCCVCLLVEVIESITDGLIFCGKQKTR